MRNSGTVILSVMLCLLLYPAALPLAARGGGMPVMRGLKQLELSDEQQMKISKLKIDMIRKTAVPKANLEVKRAELEMLWMADKPDKKAIFKKQDEIRGYEKKLLDARTDFRVDMLNVLTPEQRNKLRNFARKRGMRRGNRRQRRQRRRMGMSGRGGFGGRNRRFNMRDRRMPGGRGLMGGRYGRRFGRDFQSDGPAFPPSDEGDASGNVEDTQTEGSGQ